MKEEALKLADELLRDNTQLTVKSAYMIRRLVEELDKQTKPLSDEEIEYYEHLIAKLFNCSTTQKVIGLDRVIRAIEERHGIK